MSRNIFIPSLHSIFSNIQNPNRYYDNNYYNAERYYNKVMEYRIEEDDKNYMLEMDMPGVRKEDLEIGIKENILSISAQRKRLVKQENGESKEEITAKYEQNFNVNSKGIDLENISANLENGVLTVTLPKKEEQKYERKIEIA